MVRRRAGFHGTGAEWFGSGPEYIHKVAYEAWVAGDRGGRVVRWLSGLARNFGDVFAVRLGGEGAVGVVGGDAFEYGVQIILGEFPFERRGDLFVVLLEVEQA